MFGTLRLDDYSRRRRIYIYTLQTSTFPDQASDVIALELPLIVDIPFYRHRSSGRKSAAIIMSYVISKRAYSF